MLMLHTNRPIDVLLCSRKEILGRSIVSPRKSRIDLFQDLCFAEVTASWLVFGSWTRPFGEPL